MPPENEDSWSSSYESEEVQKIVLHVYDDESKEFTSLTTYHGMIRIYTSQTWPSRIFWTMVVVTCLTLFMIQGGVLLKSYNSHPTALKMNILPISSKFLPAISICTAGFRTNDHLYNFIVNNEYNTAVPKSLKNLPTLSIVEAYSYNCEEIVESIQFGRRNITSFCRLAKRVVTDAGICYTFRFWERFPSTSLKIQMKSFSNKNSILRIHDNYEKPTKTVSSVWVRPNSTTTVSFAVIERFALQEDNWGKCHKATSQIYEQSKCFENCEIDAILKNCGCQPFYSSLTSSSNYCTINQLSNCKNAQQTKCNCKSQCYLKDYKFNPVSTVPRKSGTVVKLKINSEIVKSYQQFKRVKQIDLMSYVGGVMGLFLGMSCITLLEVFIYLFKTVFGTLNDDRHQSFINGLLGATDDDLHRSHEEIIITKKIDSHHREDKVIEYSETFENEELLIDNHAIKGNRKMSQFALNNENNKGLKIQLYRPSLAVRRGSTYQGACDF